MTYNYFRIDLHKVWDQAMIELTTHVSVVGQAYDCVKSLLRTNSCSKMHTLHFPSFQLFGVFFALISKEHNFVYKVACTNFYRTTCYTKGQAVALYGCY